MNPLVLVATAGQYSQVNPIVVSGAGTTAVNGDYFETSPGSGIYKLSGSNYWILPYLSYPVEDSYVIVDADDYTGNKYYYWDFSEGFNPTTVILDASGSNPVPTVSQA